MLRSYGEPHWDSRTVASFAPVQSVGLFCNGACPGSCLLTCFVRDAWQQLTCLTSCAAIVLSACVAALTPVCALILGLHAGEIGQVGRSGTTWLHGFTCVAAILHHMPDEGAS